jgi:hypothetical protein
MQPFLIEDKLQLYCEVDHLLEGCLGGTNSPSIIAASTLPVKTIRSLLDEMQPEGAASIQ